MKQSTFWNKLASEYRHAQWEKSELSLFDYQMTSDGLIENLNPQPNDSILEIGCGPGTWTEIIAQKCKNLVAVDISSEMLNEAKRRCSGQKNIKFIHSDIMDVELKDKFEKIFCVRVLEYVANKKALLKKLSLMLKKNGRLVIITKSKPCFWGLAKKTAGFWQEKISVSEIESLLTGLGFSKIRSCPAIIRLPIFASGNRELPLIVGKFESWALKFFGILTKKGRTMQGSSKKAAMLFSESYLVVAQRRVN